jgi:dynein light intermediate chain, axonemal
MRVRDELKMTIAAYQTLYLSSINFGVKKQLESEEGMSELEDEVKQWEKRRDDLKKLVPPSTPSDP